MAADTAAHPRQRLDEVQLGDEQAIAQARCGKSAAKAKWRQRQTVVNAAAAPTSKAARPASNAERQSEHGADDA